MEIWKDIPKFTGYKVSNFGRIKSPNQILRLSPKATGYLQCGLSKDGKNKTVRVHRLVAEMFVPNPHNKPEVNHKNGINSDNRSENLEWVTRQENMKHAWDNGFIDNRGEKCGAAKLSKDDVIEIRQLISEGLTQREIASMYGISHTQVGAIVKNKKWKHL